MRVRSRLLHFFCAFTVFACAAVRTEELSLGTFSCDVTPPAGHPLCGGWIKPLAGVDDPELAKGVVLKDAGGTYVLCVLDWCELRDDAYDLFREKIGEAAGTPPSRVAVHCIHAHNAPIVDRRAQVLLDAEEETPVHADLSFLDAAAAKVAAAVKEAGGKMRRVTHAGTGAARVERVAATRRVPGPDGSIRVRYSSTKDTSLHEAPEGFIDPWLRTVSFFDGGTPLAYLHYYACHPQSYYGDGRATCDFPGMARERAQAETSAFQLYFTGCAGDVTAGKYNDGTPPRRTELAGRMYEAMMKSIASVDRLAVSRIEWTVRPVYFPLRKEPEQTGDFHRKRLKDAKARGIDRIHSALALSWLERCAAYRPVELSCLAMGPIRLLHLPGEPFVTFQLAAQRLRPDLFVATAGYGDCGMGYICTEASFAEGGYEPTASLVAPVSEHCFASALAGLLGVGPAPRPVLRSVTRIWDAAPHNAFTGLVRFRDRWFCAFREGAKHVSPEAGIRVLVSSDGASWESAALLEKEGVDLRDPKLCVTPDGRLMLNGGWRTWPPARARTLRSCVAFSDDGVKWSEPELILGENQWLWRVTWHEGTAYGVVYGSAAADRDAWTSHLYRSGDGRTFEKLTSFGSYPGLTEATLRVDGDGFMRCLHRRDGGTRTALLGESRPPYTEWRWRDTGFYFGGPDFIRHGGTWWAAGRLMEGPPRTALARADWERGTLEPVLFFPSGGDTSYPGLVSHGGELWVSYYSSHEGKASIYLARVGFE